LHALSGIKLEELITLLAELISVGTELLMGEIVDSNAAYIAQELKNRGVFIHWKTTVGDNLARLEEAITKALSRSDLVILGGGLGPTDDDLTREAILSAIGETAVVDEQYLAQLRSWFESRGRSFPEANIKQAWVSKSTEPLPNPVGTAPGWFTRVPNTEKIIVALPGPPREMKRMFAEQLLPRLTLPQNGFRYRTFRTVGIGESHLAEKLGALTQGSNPSIGTYARRDGVHVRVAASAASLDEATRLASPVELEVKTRLEGFIYGVDDETLPGIVLECLRVKRQTLAVLESITGGLIADVLTDTPGSSDAFAGGAVAYSNASKTQFGVSAEIIEAHGAISPEVTRELALGARDRFGASWGLAATGAADGSFGNTMPAGTLFVSVARPDGTTHDAQLTVAGDRRTMKERAAFFALGALWRELVKG
jgi:nicotinamide-nucleotide amidase